MALQPEAAQADVVAALDHPGLTSHLDAYSTLKSNAGTPLWSAPEVQPHLVRVAIFVRP